MYDIERKYKELMTIAEGKVPVLQKNDKPIKYQGINDQIHGARCLIAKCKEDERKMLKYKVMESLEAAEHTRNVCEVTNLIFVGFALMINTVGVVLNASNVKLSKEGVLEIVVIIGVTVINYMLFLGWFIPYQYKIIKKSRFLLRLFEEWDNDKKL